MVCEASLRRAPCSPPRTQVDFELAYGMLREIEVAHPEARRAVARALLALRRESEAEGLTYRVG